LVESLKRAQGGDELSESSIVELFGARGASFAAVCEAAEALRKVVNGDTVSYVVNRNINYTNVCYFGCGFCAFSKGKQSETHRGPSYDLELEEIARRTREAHARGATEVCMQGGIHPQYTGHTYLEICRAVKTAVPEMHVHAFSALEIWQGAETLGVSVARFLEQLQAAGLGTLPGTAAEILDDEIRAIICPDKINTQQWLDVIGTAHDVGLKTTSTIMFGHVDQPHHWARHLLRLRSLQQRTGGITEFVPLPFVHLEAPLYRQGMSRMGPTYRESVLMHAVARLSLHPYIANIQTSWTKMGINGARACLQAGANDLGGTLMNESISRAAGSIHGQELSPRRIEEVVNSLQRIPQQRTTLYGTVSDESSAQSFDSLPLESVDNATVSRRRRPPSGVEKKRLVRNTALGAFGSEHVS
jgi:FO synthase